MTTPSPRHLLRQAVQAAKQGDRSQARMFLAKVTEIDPEDPLGWLWRAGLAEGPEQALIWLNRCLDLDPSHPQARRALPRVRLQAAMAVAWAGDFGMARQLFEMAAAADPDAVEPWIHLASLGRSNEESLACLQEVLRRQPDHAGALACVEHLESERERKYAAAGPPTPLSVEIPPSSEDNSYHADGLPDDAFAEAARATPVEPLAIPRVPPAPLLDDSLVAEDFAIPEPRRTPPPPADDDDADFGFLPSASPKSRFPEHFAPSPAPQEPPPLPPHGPAPRRSTVLIVDDNPDVRNFVRRNLESLGLSVRDAEGAESAVTLIRESGVPDLILLDGVMPGIDGFELCNLLRQSDETRETPIVLLARKDGWLPRLKGMMSGFNDTLAKPISPGTLRSIVAKYCPLMTDAEKASGSWPEIPEEVLQ